MAFLSLVFGLGNNRTQIGALQLDALLSEETKLTADVTSYAVENGTEMSDHITKRPEELSIKGQVTGASVLLFGGGRSRLIEAKEALRQIHNDRLPVTIVTGLDAYADYAMESGVITRNNSGDHLEIDAQFKQINKTEVQQADIPPEQVSENTQTKARAGKTAQKAGRVSQTSEPEVPDTEAEKVKSQSLLHRWFS